MTQPGKPALPPAPFGLAARRLVLGALALFVCVLSLSPVADRPANVSPSITEWAFEHDERRMAVSPSETETACAGRRCAPDAPPLVLTPHSDGPPALRGTADAQSAWRARGPATPRDPPRDTSHVA